MQTPKSETQKVRMECDLVLGPGIVRIRKGGDKLDSQQMKLGEILLSHSLMTRKQLGALGRQKRSGRKVSIRLRVRGVLSG